MAVYNVVTYGATGNGSTDDTVAIQNAINACNTGISSGVVYFPAGAYKISSSLILNGKVGCVLRGDSAGSTHIYNYSSPASSIYMYNCRDCGVEMMSIHTVNPVGGNAIGINGSGGLSYGNRITDINIRSCWDGIVVVSSSDTIITRVSIRDPGAYGNYGVTCGGPGSGVCSGIIVEDLLVDSEASESQTLVGFNVDSYVNSVTIRRGVFLYGGYGFVMNDTSGVAGSMPNFAEIFDLECDHNYASGVLLAAGNAVYMTVSWIGSCLAGNGITILGSFAGDLSITSTRIMGNALNGVYVAPGPKSITIGNSIIGVNGVAGVNAYSGIVFENSGMILTSNVIGVVPGFGFTQRWGIYASPSAQNYIITSNDTSGNLTSGIQDSGFSPKIVSQNLT